ncbi:MAG: hypothetical protein ABI950_06470 [Solirubrobacteraceae bacterium]
MAAHHRPQDEALWMGDQAGDPAGWERRGVGPRWRRAYEDPWAGLRREVDRSRRHGRPLALLRMGPPHHSRLARHALVSAVRALRGSLRGVDSVWLDRRGILLLLPETDRAAAGAVMERLPTIVPAVTAAQVSLVCFPEDGLTANALRAAVSREDGPPRALPAERGMRYASDAQMPPKEAAR